MTRRNLQYWLKILCILPAVIGRLRLPSWVSFPWFGACEDGPAGDAVRVFRDPSTQWSADLNAKRAVAEFSHEEFAGQFHEALKLSSSDAVPALAAWQQCPSGEDSTQYVSRTWKSCLSDTIIPPRAYQQGRSTHSPGPATCCTKFAWTNLCVRRWIQYWCWWVTTEMHVQCGSFTGMKCLFVWRSKEGQEDEWTLTTKVSLDDRCQFSLA